MNYSGLNRPDIGRLVGQVKEYLEFQKNSGRVFFPRSSRERTDPAIGSPAPLRCSSLTALYEEIACCRKCPLFKMRRRAVTGQGNVKARLMFIGEAPTLDEDQHGRPFIGPAGELLTKMIQAIHLKREEVFITLAIKCRPPENRLPVRKETDGCRSFLMEEIRLVDPEILVAMGGDAVRTLSGSKEAISTLRGRWLDFRGKRLMATYHPDFLLKNPGAKREAWEDLKKVRRAYDELDS